MEKKLDKLEIIKERFKTEGRYGDLVEAGRMSGFTGTTTGNGLKREKYSKLKEGERKAVLQLLKILNRRRDEEREFDKELMD